jgi:proteasome lid subunit RPN8/RPN11
MTAIEERGEEIAAIYHSHTKSAAYPSQTDVNLAANWPDPLYLICSVADPETPEVRVFTIRDGRVEEAELEVEAG